MSDGYAYGDWEMTPGWMIWRPAMRRQRRRLGAVDPGWDWEYASPDEVAKAIREKTGDRCDPPA